MAEVESGPLKGQTAAEQKVESDATHKSPSVRRDFSTLAKSAKQANESAKSRALDEFITPPKTNWKRVMKLIIKILEPELAKLPKWQLAIPLVMIILEVVGIIQSSLFIIKIVSQWAN